MITGSVIPWAIVGLVAICFMAFFWLVKNAGKDEQRADSAEEALDDIVKANKPVSADELKLVKEKYQRD